MHVLLQVWSAIKRKGGVFTLNSGEPEIARPKTPPKSSSSEDEYESEVAPEEQHVAKIDLMSSKVTHTCLFFPLLILAFHLTLVLGSFTLCTSLSAYCGLYSSISIHSTLTPHCRHQTSCTDWLCWTHGWMRSTLTRATLPGESKKPACHAALFINTAALMLLPSNCT